MADSVIDPISDDRSPPAYAKPPPGWLPHVVMVCFALILIFILVATVVSGLVLGGRISVQAKAIGLTQSLVLFSSVFGVAYIAFHIYASRKVSCDKNHDRHQKTPLHTRIVVVSRITIGLWAAALIAVGITLASKTTQKEATTLGPLRADLAACAMNCLTMGLVGLIIERGRNPFVLPWITPAVPREQSPSAKALIHNIIFDGVSGSAFWESKFKKTTNEVDEPVKNSMINTSTDTLESTSDSQTAVNPGSSYSLAKKDTPCTEPLKSSNSSTVERRQLWQTVDEGSTYNEAQKPQAPLIQTPLPAPVMTPAACRVRNHAPSMTKETQFTPSLYSTMGTNADHGTSNARFSQILGSLPNNDSKPRQNAAKQGKPEGKRLFNRAVEGLKYTGPKETQDWGNWNSSIRVPGSFVED